MVEEHDTLLRGASFLGGGAAPALLQRTDDDPVGVLLEKLASAAGREDLAQSPAGLKLFQPVHRTWHLALLEVACQAPGLPRLDPKRIESAGLVIRRVGTAGALEGWRRAGRALRGWLPFGSGEERLDPDPKKRRPAVGSGHPEIDRRLLLLNAGEPLEESVSPLFVAPPEVCQAAGKTLLYGLVPVASAERSETPAAAADLDTDAFAQAARDQIPVLLKSARDQTYSWNGRDLTPDSKASSGGLTSDLDLLSATLQHLHVQLDAFDGGPAASQVLTLLDQVSLLFGTGTSTYSRPAGRFLAEAAEVLLFRSPGAEGVRTPNFWPAIPEPVLSQVAGAIVSSMQSRLGTLTAGEGRFDALGRSYVLEAFVRVRGHQPGCPSKLVWTTASTPPFTIVPWYEAGALPPTQVTLPDLNDRGALRKLKPNVAFVLPQGLKDAMDRNSLAGLSKGEGSGLGFGLGWICGFNIPLITLCAFFVLNIFLQLLNIVFFWLPFIKICIPFPRKK
ncbi:MAG TPA: hypothetical protein VGM86_28860 [Thermoanaerobaculia bacterium]